MTNAYLATTNAIRSIVSKRGGTVPAARNNFWEDFSLLFAEWDETEGAGSLPTVLANAVALGSPASPSIWSIASGNSVSFRGIGLANGVASLGADGLVPVAQLPGTIGGSTPWTKLGSGSWNASTNTPTLSNDAGYDLGSGVQTANDGEYFLVSVGGSTSIDGISSWSAGDLVWAVGGNWYRTGVSLAGVTSVTTPLGGTVSGAVNLTVANFNARLNQIAGFANPATNSAIQITTAGIAQLITIGTGNGLATLTGGKLTTSQSPTIADLGGQTVAQADARYPSINGLAGLTNPIAARAILGLSNFVDNATLTAAISNHNADIAAHTGIFLAKSLFPTTAGFLTQAAGQTTFNSVTLTGSAGQITVTNGSGGAGPVFSLADFGVTGKRRDVEIDTKGRVLAGMKLQPVTYTTSDLLNADEGIVIFNNSGAEGFELPPASSCLYQSITLIRTGAGIPTIGVGGTETLILPDNSEDTNFSILGVGNWIEVYAQAAGIWRVKNFSQSPALVIAEITGSTTIVELVASYKCTNSSPANVTLPTPNTAIDLVFRCTSASVTLITPSGEFEQFPGSDELILVAGDVAFLKSDGVNYYIN